MKSLEYLKDIKNEAFVTDKGLCSVLEYIGYILADNGYDNARYFLDEIVEKIEDKEIEL